MATSRLSSHAGTAGGGNGTKSSSDPSLDDRRAGFRVGVEGPASIWLPGVDAPQPAQMRDVSAGGAFLETTPLPLGQEILVEIEGECSSFTVSAVVTRSRFDSRAKGAIAIRFVDRDPRRYGKWLLDECVRLSMWMCSDTTPLFALDNAAIPQPLDDPGFIPVHSVYQIIRSQPSTSLADLLGLATFEPMHIRIAVARLLESRALTVMKPGANEKTASPSVRLIGRFRRPRSPVSVRRLP